MHCRRRKRRPQAVGRSWPSVDGQRLVSGPAISVGLVRADRERRTLREHSKVAMQVRGKHRQRGS